MVQDRLSKLEAGELLDQQVHVVTAIHKLCHSTRNFLQVDGEYLVDEGPLRRYMSICPRHIDYFERQYDKTFAGNYFFGADLVDCIHKHVQVFLHLCNTTFLTTWRWEHCRSSASFRGV